MALYDSWALVGATGEDTIAPGAGAVYAYERNTGIQQWLERQKLVRADGGFAHSFGNSVSISENRAAIAAYGDDANGVNSGRVFIYTRDPTTGLWTFSTDIIPGDNAFDMRFGLSVVLDRNVLVVSAAEADSTDICSTGALYVFDHDSISETWIPRQKIESPSKKASDRFGTGKIALRGQWLAIPAAFDNTLGSSAGALHVYKSEPLGTQWNHVQMLTAADAESHEMFGCGAVLGAKNWLLAHAETATQESVLGERIRFC